MEYEAITTDQEAPKRKHERTITVTTRQFRAFMRRVVEGIYRENGPDSESEVYWALVGIVEGCDYKRSPFFTFKREAFRIYDRETD